MTDTSVPCTRSAFTRTDDGHLDGHRSTGSHVATCKDGARRHEEMWFALDDLRFRLAGLYLGF